MITVENYQDLTLAATCNQSGSCYHDTYSQYTKIFETGTKINYFDKKVTGKDQFHWQCRLKNNTQQFLL